MSQTRSSNTPQQSGKDLPPHVIEQIVENQKQQLFLKSQENKLKEREMELNAKLAEKQMGFQADILKQRPGQQLNYLRWGGLFVVIVIILFASFFIYCLQFGHEDFALKVFGYLMYVIVTLGGYWAGRKAEQRKQVKKPEEVSQEATVLS